MNNTKTEIRNLRGAISNLHRCKSKWIESVPVKETFQGEIAWRGIVEVFDLTDHPTAKRCYAWSHAVEGSTKRKFIAVLQQGPVDSPRNAVKAAIVSEYRR